MLASEVVYFGQTDNLFKILILKRLYILDNLTQAFTGCDQ